MANLPAFKRKIMTHSTDLSSQSEMVQSLDVDGNVLEVSPQWLAYTGYKQEEVIGKHFTEFLDQTSVKQVKLNFPHLKDYGFVDNVPLTLIRNDGVNEATILNGSSSYDENGQFLQTFCELRTLDYFKNSNIALITLLEKERFFKIILNLKANIAGLIAQEWEYTEFLRELELIFQEPAEIKTTCTGIHISKQALREKIELELKSFEQKNHIIDKVYTYDCQQLSEKFAIEAADFLIVMNLKNPMVEENQSTILLAIKSNIEQMTWLAAFQDIVNTLESAFSAFKNRIEKAQLIEELKSLASTDSLTGLYNRQKLKNVLTNAQDIFERYHRPFSCIMLDIDNFKQINDQLGHSKGDEVLVSIAQTLQIHSRKTDIVARWGGEEFLIVLPETKADQASILANTLCKQIQNLKVDKLKTCSASFGVTEFTQSDSIDTMLIRVDKALYQAKHQGKHQVVTL